MGVRALPGTRIANPVTQQVIYSPPEGLARYRDQASVPWSRLSTPRHTSIRSFAWRLPIINSRRSTPFNDGNGRTGRILNMLLLVEAGLLQTPVLYLSRYIIDHKQDYYRLLADVTRVGAWEEWVLYMVEAVRSSAVSTLAKIDAIDGLAARFSEEAADVTPGLRHAGFLSVLFAQPYARIGDVMDRCEVSRPTAAGWLNDLVAAGMLTDVKVGRDRLFLNTKYLELLAERGD